MKKVKKNKKYRCDQKMEKTEIGKEMKKAEKNMKENEKLSKIEK